MEKKILPIISVGLLVCQSVMKGSLNRAANPEGNVNNGNANTESNQANGSANKPQTNYKDKKENNMGKEYTVPGIALNEFISRRYQIGFKYPRGWSKNPRYEDKYEGESGFFEVSDFSGNGRNIDEAVKQQINEPYKPYGNNPTVRNFTVDGQPARVIYPSTDQNEFYKDRDAALVVQYKEPLVIGDNQYNYVVIWATKEYIPLIMSTFKFVK